MAGQPPIRFRRPTGWDYAYYLVVLALIGVMAWGWMDGDDWITLVAALLAIASAMYTAWRSRRDEGTPRT